MGTSSWCDSSGLVSQSPEGGPPVSKGSGMTRGDRKRNARRERLRGLLPRNGAVVGIDLAGDKQALAVVDHDVRVPCSVDLCDRSLPPAGRERERLLDRDFLVDQGEVDALAVT